MQNHNLNREKTNDEIENLKSSISNLTDLVKSLQSLSGRLSLIGDECKNISNLSKQFQSNVSKMQKSLTIIELEEQKISQSSEDFWLKPHPKVFKQLLPIENKQLQTNFTPNRDDKTFKQYLSKIQQDYRLCVNDAYDLLFNFILHISESNGYIYGGFVRDFVVPVLVYGQNATCVDFKDIDIWFENQSLADDFINGLNQQNSDVQLIPQTHLPDESPNQGYGCGHPFTRKRKLFTFQTVPLFMVDVVVAQQLPVNDFSVNLLMFKAKDRNLENISLSWFCVGQNYDGEFYKYSVLILIEMIANHITDKLSGYMNLPKGINNDYKRIVKDRCDRMIEWGWLVHSVCY